MGQGLDRARTRAGTATVQLLRGRPKGNTLKRLPDPESTASEDERRLDELHDDDMGFLRRLQDRAAEAAQQVRRRQRDLSAYGLDGKRDNTS